MSTTEMKMDANTMAERSLGTILDVVRHLQYYVAPWQNLNLEKEAAMALGELFESRDNRIFRHLLTIDPIFGSTLAEYVGQKSESRMYELTRDFDLTHSSYLSQTFSLGVRSMRAAIREDSQAYVA